MEVISLDTETTLFVKMEGGFLAHQKSQEGFKIALTRIRVDAEVRRVPFSNAFSCKCPLNSEYRSSPILQLIISET